MRTREKRIHFVFYKKITKLLLQNQTKILTSEIERETPKKQTHLDRREFSFFFFLICLNIISISDIKFYIFHEAVMNEWKMYKSVWHFFAFWIAKKTFSSRLKKSVRFDNSFSSDVFFPLTFFCTILSLVQNQSGKIYFLYYRNVC